jgi:IPT/TIG domain
MRILQRSWTPTPATAAAFREMRKRPFNRRASAGRRAAPLAILAATAAATATPAMGQLLGQHLFPTNNAWNQNISAAPVATNSAAIIASIGATTKVHPDWGADNSTNGTSPLYGIPYNVVHGNSTAKVNVTIDNYPGESDIIPAPIPSGAVIEGDYQNGPNPNGAGYGTGQRGDSHLIVWDEDNNIGYEFYGMTRPSDTNLLDGVTPNTNHTWQAAQETVWNFNTNDFRPLGWTSADAAGLSILAGLARPDEGLPVSQGGQGAINHAMRMTLPQNVVSKQYIYPASHVVSESGGAPLGTRLRLRNTTAINTLISEMGPESQIVARAMQQYGLILADVGSAMYVTGASGSVNATNHLSLVWDQSDIFGSIGLRSLVASNFDVVNLTPIVTGLSASNGVAGNALTVTGQNFSGAAGQISVLFSNTPASSVNVLSDSQISVIVPGGSGTVDVKVQSGAYEPDKNDGPGANVNEPIFGYGTSAATAADRFTYLPVPKIQSAMVRGGYFIMRGTNNTGPGGTYQVLTSTNLLLSRANWTVLTNLSFDGNGNFSFTNAIASGSGRLFYGIRVP